MADITCKNCGTVINIMKAQKGVVICPNCEIENDCSEQIYEHASSLMASAGNEVSYKAAAEAFSRIEGYKDADMYRDNCLEQASICFKDATFLRAKTEMMKGDRAGLSFACHLLESISGWKDADEQLGICKMRLEALAGKGHDGSADNIYSPSNKGFLKKDRTSGNGIHTRIKNPSDNPVQSADLSSDNIDTNNEPLSGKTKKAAKEKNAAKVKKASKTVTTKNKKLNTIIIASCIGLALVGALVAVYFLVITPMLRYDEAMELINNGSYSDGYAILTELGRDEEINDNKRQRAQEYLEKEDYDKAYGLLGEVGDFEKANKSILERVSALVEEEKHSEAVALVGKYSFEGFDDMKLERAESLINDSEYDEAYILLSGNDSSAFKDKRNSIRNVSPTLRFLDKKKGDIVTFGELDIDGNTGNGSEKLEWKIIDEDGDSYLVLCESFIDALAFDGAAVGASWSKSLIRKVLNLSYFERAFSAKEKEIIIEKNVHADSNPSYETDPGTDSTSSLFILSCNELNRLLPDKSSRIISGSGSELATHNWWLRTPGVQNGNITFVDEEGNINLEGAPANMPFNVRPAMWVKKI